MIKMEKKLKIVLAGASGAAAAIVFIVIVTMAAELSPNFKDFLKNWFSHHWIGKGLLAILIFLAVSFPVYFVFRKAPTIDKTAQSLLILGWTAIVGIWLIFGFYVYEFYFL